MMPLLLMGCAAYAYEGPVAYETVHRGPDAQNPYVHRVDRDVHAYVQRLDRRLRLTPRQQQRLNGLLKERTYDLLHRTRRAQHDRVYPFPRRSGRTAYYAGRWWNETDRRIENVLNRRQIREYRALTRGDRYDDRRDNRRDDRRDDRRRRGYDD